MPNTETTATLSAPQALMNGYPAQFRLIEHASGEYTIDIGPAPGAGGVRLEHVTATDLGDLVTLFTV